MEYHENELIQNKIQRGCRGPPGINNGHICKEAISHAFFFFIISRLPNCNHPLTGKVYVSSECRHGRVQRNSLSRYAPQRLAAGIACSQRECPGQVGSWTRSPRVSALFPLGAPVFPPQSKTHPASALEQ